MSPGQQQQTLGHPTRMKAPLGGRYGDSGRREMTLPGQSGQRRAQRLPPAPTQGTPGRPPKVCQLSCLPVRHTKTSQRASSTLTLTPAASALGLKQVSRARAL